METPTPLSSLPLDLHNVTTHMALARRRRPTGVNVPNITIKSKNRGDSAKTDDDAAGNEDKHDYLDLSYADEIGDGFVSSFFCT